MSPLEISNRDAFLFIPPAPRVALDDLSNRDLTAARALGAALNDLVDATHDMERTLAGVMPLLLAGLPFDPRPVQAARERLREALKLPPACVVEDVRIVRIADDTPPAEVAARIAAVTADA